MVKSKFEIKNPGENYYSLPITTIKSDLGTTAIISGVSTSMVKLEQ